jgi:hypothetical protein
MEPGKACACGRRAKIKKNGDLGFQIDLAPRVWKPAFVYVGGEVRRRS